MTMFLSLPYQGGRMMMMINGGGFKEGKTR
jgi:hypothetical protein